ncbi:dihydrofolate reductase [Kribbella aluminosa]|uniref:Dihydrofolate reductase n=1 Tax=Kribbella aluminosa TaxID=416017 RepID=A0ABS4UXR2_9ACTN|nr:dihydrofolate reductase family protein [Kribbella aluminosa]MBP2356443.1 dihydrofolate reductase [Kribbella aluminosa]
MSKLVYAALASLDGYVEDAAGEFDWAAPDDEVHAFVNELERPIGTYLYGRRMYETMSYWQTATGLSPVTQAYADIWRAADKLVYSRTLDAISTPRTRLVRDFTPAEIRDLKQSVPQDLSIGGAALAAEALRAGLVDELHLFLSPVVVGGGKPALPGNLRLPLTLIDEHRFNSGFVHLHYSLNG